MSDSTQSGKSPSVKNWPKPLAPSKPETLKLLSRKANIWIIRGAGLLFVLGFGIPYVYVHYVTPKPPGPLSFDDVNETSAPDDSTRALPTNWTVVQPARTSYVVIDRGDSNTNVDTRRTASTSIVSGSAVLTRDQIEKVTITVSLTTLGSNDPNRDKRFRSSITASDKFPLAVLTIGPSAVSFRNSTEATVEGTINLIGLDRTASIELRTRRVRGRFGERVELTGSAPLVWASWGIADPFPEMNPPAPPRLEFSVTLVATPSEQVSVSTS
jgi:polyisoprenoid-binding protein YceI